MTDYNGDLVLTDKWDRVLQKLKWSKHKGTTEKGKPSPQLFVEEKFTFFGETFVSEQDILPSSIINIDQTPLPYVNTRKYTFSFKGAKNIQSKVWIINVK